MNRKETFKVVYLIALAVTFLASSTQVFSQSKVSDFDKPLTIISRSDHLNVDEAEELISSSSDLIVLDVRKKREYDKEHLPNAIHADYFSKDFQMKLAELDKSKPYIVYCKSGTRSDETVRRMKSLGIEDISVIGGGFRAWRASGKETVAGKI